MTTSIDFDKLNHRDWDPATGHSSNAAPFESLENWQKLVECLRTYDGTLPHPGNMINVGNLQFESRGCARNKKIKVTNSINLKCNQKRVVSMRFPSSKKPTTRVRLVEELANWISAKIEKQDISVQECAPMTLSPRHTCIQNKNKIDQIPPKTSTNKELRGLEFEELVFEILNEKAKILKNVILIPLPDKSRVVGAGDDADEEYTWANQIDMLAWDGTTLWIVECKCTDAHKNGRFAPDTILKKLKENEKNLRLYLDFTGHSSISIGYWLISTSTSAPDKFTSYELQTGARPCAEPDFWKVLMPMSPDENVSFKERLDYLKTVRDFRTKRLCLVPRYGLGTTAKGMRRQITGCAGAGKSVILCFHAYQFATGKAVTSGDLSDELNNYASVNRSIYLLAPELSQVKVLMEIMKSICLLFGNPSASGDEQLFNYLQIKDFLKEFEENTTVQPPVAVFIDETQDLEVDCSQKLADLLGADSYIGFAYDRLQRLSGNGDADEVVKNLNGNFKCNSIKLNIQYRQPVPLFLVSLALAYRWNSTGTMFVPPSQKLGNDGTVQNLLLDVWGIYNANVMNKGDKKGQSRDPLSPYWSKSFSGIQKTYSHWEIKKNSNVQQVNCERGQYNAVHSSIKQQHRLSLRCDAHPSSHWLVDGKSFSIRTKIDKDLKSLLRPDDQCEKKDVLWVSFGQGQGQCSDWSNVEQLGAENPKVYSYIADKIKGREWSVVVIKNVPEGYNSEDQAERILASKIMYLVASRATAVLYLLEGTDESKMLIGEPIKIPKNCSYKPYLPGFLDNEFEDNLGLRYGKNEAETGYWWHLSWKLPDSAELVAPLFGLNIDTDDASPEDQEEGLNDRLKDADEIQIELKSERQEEKEMTKWEDTQEEVDQRTIENEDFLRERHETYAADLDDSERSLEDGWPYDDAKEV